jgi:hypothetical protein
MFPLRHKAPLGDRSRYRLRVIERCPRTTDQAFHPSAPVSARQPLVAGPAAHAEASAHSCKRLFLPLNHHDKAHPLIYGTGPHPSHRQGPPRRSVDLLPMSPVWTGFSRSPRGPMISYQFGFSVLLEIARLTPGGPLCRLAALKTISATAAKDATSTAPENA